MPCRCRKTRSPTECTSQELAARDVNSILWLSKTNPYNTIRRSCCESVTLRGGGAGRQAILYSARKASINTKKPC